MSPDAINRRAALLAFLWGAIAALVLSLTSYLLSQPEPACPRGQHFVHPAEQCIGPVMEGGR